MIDILLLALGMAMAVGITGYLQRFFAPTNPEFLPFLKVGRWVLVTSFGFVLLFTLFSLVLDLIGA